MKKTSPKLKKLVKILSDGAYHSGSALGLSLHISRSAIWKLINQLHSYNIPIQATKAKGYCMEQPLSLLDSRGIKKHINCKENREKCAIEVYSSITSTNDHFKTKALANTNHQLHVCLAEQQTTGKGRLGRSWYSPFGVNIYLSCCKVYHKDISELGGLSLVIGLAIVKALGECGVKDKIKVKWPNDIYYDNKKLAGILMEVVAETHGTSKIIIGVGLNTNMTEDNLQIKPIDKTWTSLITILKQYQDRNKIVGIVLNEIMHYLDKFEQSGLPAFLPEWRQFDFLYQQQVTLVNANKTITGIVLGINDQGHLLVEKNDGNIQAYASGDTTIQKFV